MKHDLRRGQFGKSESLSDFDRASRREPTGERRRCKASGDRVRDDGRAAAKKDLRPGDAGGVERASGDVANAAGWRQRGQTQRLARPVREARRREPAEMLGRENLAVAPVVLPADNRRVDFAAIESIEEVPRIVEPHLDGERRVVRIQPRQQGRHFGARHMGRYAERKTAASRG